MFTVRSVWYAMRRPLLVAAIALALPAGWASAALPSSGPVAEPNATASLDVTFVVVAGPDLGMDGHRLSDQVEDIGTAINLVDQLRWPATAADGKTPMGGAGLPVAEPRGVVVVGDLTGGFSYPGYEGACYDGEPWQMTNIRTVFERGLSSAGYNIVYPTYLGLGDHDLSPQQVDPECGQELIWGYIDNLYAHQAGVSYDSASHAYAWDWGGLHLVQLQRYGGDTGADLSSSLDFLADDLAAAADAPTILFQHYGWDARDGSWTGAERRALDRTIAGANVIAAFHGPGGTTTSRTGHYISAALGDGQIDIFSVLRSVDGDGGAPKQSARFALVHVTDRYLDLAYVEVPALRTGARPADPADWLTMPQAYRFTTCYGRAPALNTRYSPALTPIVEGASDPAGDRVGAIIPDGAITGASAKAIAVTRVDDSHGTWQYRVDADSDWTAFGSPSARAARLLGPHARIRFLPDAGWHGEATFTFRAWDVSTGTSGGTADTRASGGCTAFSAASDTASITVRSAPLAVSGPGDDQTCDEGDERSFDLGSFSGGSGPWAVRVDWGDGEHSSFDVEAPGVIPAQRHTYRDGPQTRTVEVRVSDQKDTTASASFEVAVSNVAPTLSDLSASGPEGTALALPAASFAAHTSDPGDDRLQAIRITTLPAHGTLKLGGDALAADHEIPVTWSGDSPAFGDTLAFVPDDEWAGTTALGWNGYDGDDWADGDATATLTIVEVTSPNEPPVNAVPGAFALDEDSTQTGLAFGVADSDAGDAAVRFTLSAAHGTLTLHTLAGLTLVAGADGSATMTCEGTLASINAALGDVTYRPDDDYSGGDTITLQSDDRGHSGAGGAKTDEDTVGVTVRPVNDPPVLDLSAAGEGTGYSAGFSGAGLVAIAGSDLTLADVDDTEMESATVTLTARPDGAAEVLAVSTAGTAISAHYEASTGALRLTGADTIAHYRQVLASATYNNTSAHPDPAERTATFVVSDGEAGSDAATSTVHMHVAEADLRLSMQASSDPVAAGAELTYTLTVTNDGPHRATGVTIEDALPAGVSYHSASASQGSCTHSGSTVTCSLGALASGKSATVTLGVRLDAGASGALTNMAKVTAETFDPVQADNSATVATRVTTLAGLSPDHVWAGSGAFTLTVKGTHFATGAQVLWNGAARTTTYVSATELRAAIPASDVRHAGTARVSVANPSPGGTTSALPFAVRSAPTPTATPAPAVIRLQVELTSWAGVSWGELWAVVQWLDGAGVWHDVEGWQSRLEGAGGSWVVAPCDFGKGPFRWALTRGDGGALVAVSESFRLPGGAGQTVERLVRVTAPMPTWTSTPRPRTPTPVPPTAQPSATPAGPTAAPTATATPVGTVTPTATLRPSATATPHGWPTSQPTPTPAPEGPRHSLLVEAAAALVGLLAVGIAAGWLWQRGLRR